MQLRARIFSIVVIVALMLPTLSVLGYNLYIDPFQIFHKDLTEPTVILGGRGADRYQHAGIINQYDIDSVIIGHSHSANYLPSQLEKELGWEKVYTLTMDGALLYEQAMVAKHVFSKHTVKNVLWGVSVSGLMRPWMAVNKKLPLKEYLYDGNRLNDLRFFLTFDLFKYNDQKQKRKDQILVAENSSELAESEFDNATSWYEQNGCRFNRPVFIADKILRGKTLQYDEVSRKKLVRLAPQELMKAPPELSKRYMNYKDNLQRNILPILNRTPLATFNFVLTAYPTLKMQRMKISYSKMYKEYLQVLRAFVLDTHEFQNVNIFGFDIEKFTNDLRFYKDGGHYHLAVNNFIVERISTDKNLLTPLNIDDYIVAFDDKVSRFRLSDRWNPQNNKQFMKSGYLSMEAAQLLIQGDQRYSDTEITQISFQDKSLPECAVKIERRIIDTIE